MKRPRREAYFTAMLRPGIVAAFGLLWLLPAPPVGARGDEVPAKAGAALPQPATPPGAGEITPGPPATLPDPPLTDLDLRSIVGRRSSRLPSGGPADVSAELEALESFDFATKLVGADRLAALTLDDLKRLRGLVFGRHGRYFKEADIQAYLESRPWYTGSGDFKNSDLTATENQNLDLIREAEAKKHANVEPGDLRFWRDQAFSAARLGRHSATDLRIMRAEIEAIHGKRFPADPWLQSYFEERYWYHASDSYQPGSLTEIERRNLATVIAAQKGGRNLKLTPGDMGDYQKALITTSLLEGLSLHELRLLRNEVYARHGKMFTGWLGNFFYAQDWYEPDSEARVKLSRIEEKNVAIIGAYEKSVREALTTSAVTPSLLEGMRMEDARTLRNEIYARHGKVFKDKGLQKYFSSFAWYRPDPAFRDSMLSPLEKKNAAVILAYERTAESEMDMAEG